MANVRILNPKTDKYVLARGDIGSRLTRNMVQFKINIKNDQLDTIMAHEISDIMHREIPLKERQFIANMVIKSYRSQIENEKKSYEKSSLQIYANNTKREEQRRINRINLTNEFKKYGLVITNERYGYCDRYIRYTNTPSGSWFKKTLSHVVTMVGNQRYLNEYSNVPNARIPYHFTGRNNTYIAGTVTRFHTEYPTTFPWIFEKELYMITTYLYIKRNCKYLPKEIIGLICDCLCGIPNEKGRKIRLEYNKTW